MAVELGLDDSGKVRHLGIGAKARLLFDHGEDLADVLGGSVPRVFPAL